MRDNGSTEQCWYGSIRKKNLAILAGKIHWEYDGASKTVIVSNI